MDVRRIVVQHGWKLCLIPLFFDVPLAVKYGCAAILAASLVWDLVRWRQEGKQPAA
jgi:hypothetical protein